MKNYEDIMYDLTKVATSYSREEGCRGLKFRHMVKAYFKDNNIDTDYQANIEEDAMDVWEDCYLS